MTRFLDVASGLAWAVLLGSGAASAQDAAGKLEGRVRDPDGVAVASAQLRIPGTAFVAVTSRSGYYFFNGLPPGTVALRAAAIGYAGREIRGIRILAGQSSTQDIVLEPAPLQLETITVTTAENPLVPRDAVTTKQTIPGDFVDRLPVDEIAQVLELQPGVVRTQRGELTLRGGRPDESVVYLDGVPVSPGFRLNTPGFLGVPPTTLDLGTNALEQASVTTGALAAEFGNAQAGIIALQSRSGGNRFSGALGYETDEFFGRGHSLGLNRFTASLGGPLIGNLRFYLSGVLQGQRSEEGGFEAERAPLFLAAGVDTSVAVPSAIGDPNADTTYVAVQQYAVARGTCEPFRQSRNSGIASNYGLPCGSVQVPWSFDSRYQVLGKLSYTYGSGSQLRLTFAASQQQGRGFDYDLAFEPLYSPGYRFRNDLVTLAWRQNLSRSAERAMSVDVLLSYQRDHSMGGPLSPAGELASRDPALGIRVKPLGFLFDFHNWPITPELVRHFLLQDGGASPVDLANPDDFLTVDRYRNNPYGILGFSEGGGPLGVLNLQRERRIFGKAVLDWQVDRQNRVRAGAEVMDYAIGFYGHRLGSSQAADIWIRNPVRWAAFAEDRLDLGDVVLIGGLRYDRFDSDGRAPVWYDSTSGSYRYFPRILTNPDFDQDNPDAVFRPFRSHGYLSPHVQVSFPVTDRTNFRFSYAHQAQVPEFASVLRRANTDFGLSGGLYGSDLGFTRTVLFEFGVRQSFGPDMVVDIAAFAKNKLADITGRALPLFDPLQRDTVNVQRLTTQDFGIVKGIDIRLDRRIGEVLNGFVAYSFQDARNSGDDPLSYLNRQSALVSATTGVTVLPPEAVLTTRDSRPHNLTGALALQFPSGYRSGTLLGRLLERTGALASFRFASGTAYTACPPGSGNDNVTSDLGGCSFQSTVPEFNGARLPSEKQFDLRLTRGIPLGSLEATVYLDIRNLFNFRNVLKVFSASKDIVSRSERERAWVSDSTAWLSEGGAAGVVDSAGNLDLRFGGTVAAGCGNWVTANTDPAAPNCVYLIRAEERYGNGDHIFDVTEMRRASEAYYAAIRGPQTFLGPPRRLRLGVELSF